MFSNGLGALQWLFRRSELRRKAVKYTKQERTPNLKAWHREICSYKLEGKEGERRNKGIGTERRKKYRKAKGAVNHKTQFEQVM
jgi:hypothetical protein